MAETFFEQPILNSPYQIPTQHHELDADGQPTDRPPVQGRRRSELITPVPKPRKRKRRSPKQGEMVFADALGLTDAGQESTTPPRSSTRSGTMWTRGGACRIPAIGR